MKTVCKFLVNWFGLVMFLCGVGVFWFVEIFGRWRPEYRLAEHYPVLAWACVLLTPVAFAAAVFLSVRLTNSTRR